MEFANLTDLVFEPLARSVPVDATGTSYTTPTVHRAKLKDLARLTYVTGVFRWSLEAPGSQGEYVVRLVAGSTTLASFTVASNGAGFYSGAEPVSLQQVLGDTAIRVELETTFAAEASSTARVAGALQVSHPIVFVRG